MENLNQYLYLAAGVLTLLEIAIRWVIPAVRKNSVWAGWVETLDSLWVAMLVALALKAILVQPFVIPSGSMEDTLRVGDYILVKKYEYGYSLWNSTDRFLEFRKPRRGDIIVFVFPKDHSKDFIKRCIGTPGDVVTYRNKELFVNGEKQVEPYVQHIDPRTLPPGDPYEPPGDPGSALEDQAKTSRDTFGPVTVQAGHYFMMGDNRDNSLDSRYWGQVDEKLIKGQAWMIYWHAKNFLPDFSRMFRMVH